MGSTAACVVVVVVVPVAGVPDVVVCCEKRVCAWPIKLPKPPSEAGGAPGLLPLALPVLAAARASACLKKFILRSKEREMDELVSVQILKKKSFSLATNLKLKLGRYIVKDNKGK